MLPKFILSWDQCESYEWARIVLNKMVRATDPTDSSLFNTLNISDNRLAWLDPSFIGDWGKLDEVGIGRNPWVCDCENNWFLSELMPRIAQLHPEEASRLVFTNLLSSTEARAPATQLGSQSETRLIPGTVSVIPTSCTMAFWSEERCYGNGARDPNAGKAGPTCCHRSSQESKTIPKNVPSVFRTGVLFTSLGFSRVRIACSSGAASLWILLIASEGSHTNKTTGLQQIVSVRCEDDQNSTGLITTNDIYLIVVIPYWINLLRHSPTCIQTSQYTYLSAGLRTGNRGFSYFEHHRSNGPPPRRPCNQRAVISRRRRPFVRGSDGRELAPGEICRIHLRTAGGPTPASVYSTEEVSDAWVDTTTLVLLGLRYVPIPWITYLSHGDHDM
ncbi:unnamed protein product [Nesidiocoris tenuis]|uniref:LRRCT domain-containing protein n=1 Tax=Nesidiocoris tenuis TaxID=355587 RepID=A0A6H5HBC1_9HEMI|nr:unnamed protein product [Nesidiocoris tenuis]